jgi:hypothetical protein
MRMLIKMSKTVNKDIDSIRWGWWHAFLGKLFTQSRPHIGITMVVWELKQWRVGLWFPSLSWGCENVVWGKWGLSWDELKGSLLGQCRVVPRWHMVTLNIALQNTLVAIGDCFKDNLVSHWNIYLKVLSFGMHLGNLKLSQELGLARGSVSN